MSTTTQHLSRPSAAGRARFPRLGARTRKVTLIVHLSSVAAWFGMHFVLGVLTFAALGAPAESAPAFALSIAMFVGWPLIVAASSSALLFTIAISVIKPWGRTRRDAEHG
ncbi:hypothetical protein [Microbacterium sp. Bi121]|uniref:hypothetical protein n=1 Tax=Microbacterium sp. Bi121 TaxID=2822348 RepID=UPI001D28CDF1|nr:hypothetical protein [Microbacterium sp. Bi121]CAH0217041.1 hypothetical protein SRABI121_02875 [Microbacterium sp. Bi121]